MVSRLCLTVNQVWKAMTVALGLALALSASVTAQETAQSGAASESVGLIVKARQSTWPAGLENDLINVLKNTSEDIRVRMEACYQLARKPQRLSGTGRDAAMAELVSTAKSDESAEIRRQAIRSLAQLCVYNNEQKAQEKNREARDLIQEKVKSAVDQQERTEAVRAAGRMGLHEAMPELKTLMLSKDESRRSLVRAACLSVARIDVDEAMPLIETLAETCDDASVFETALYSARMIPDVRALTIIMKNRDRFPDSGAVGFSVMALQDVVMGTLSDPTSPHLDEAIAATSYFWREELRAEAWDKLVALFPVCGPEHRRAIALQFVSFADKLPFEQEKARLAEVLILLEGQQDLPDLTGRIRARMGAIVLKPAEDKSLVTTRDEE